MGYDNELQSIIENSLALGIKTLGYVLYYDITKNLYQQTK